MNNIIYFKKAYQKKHKRRKKDMAIKEIIKELEEKNNKGEQYSPDEIKLLAQNILDNIEYYSKCGATPIVKIAKEFGFNTYKELLPSDKSGDIHINGDTIKRYGSDKVILVNNQEDLFHLRFVIAHELAHYLFDFIGNRSYYNNDVLFSEPYNKNQHETDKEKRANIFAAEIMMPRDLFVKQYNIAVRENSNHMFIVMYLSRFFETTIDSIEKRIMEVSL